MLHVATLFEATPLIRGLGLQRTRIPGVPQLYQSGDARHLLWISGIGSEACRRSLQRISGVIETLRGPHQWINIGIAGCNHRSIAKGTLFQMTTLHSPPSPSADHPIQLRARSFPQACTLPTAALTTVRTPEIRSRDCKPSEPVMLYDMEAYVFARTLLDTLAVTPAELHCFKVVSDYADGAQLNLRSLAPAYDAAITCLLPLLHAEPGK